MVLVRENKHLFSIFILIIIIGCSTQQFITGDPILYGINNYTGAIIDRDLFPRPPQDEPDPGSDAASVGQFSIGIIPHRDEVISIVVDSVFVRYLSESVLTSPHVLAWVEVYDDGSDDPQKALTRVLYNGPNQPADTHLPLASRVIYGPTQFKGFPIRIRFFIVELDKEDKETGAALIETVGAVAAASSPEAAPAISLAMQFAQAINALNEDDYELRYDVTLLPIGPSGFAKIGDTELRKSEKTTTDGQPQNAEPAQRLGSRFAIATPLRTGSFVILKRELAVRKVTKTIFGTKPSVEHIQTYVERDWTQEWFRDSFQQPDGTPTKIDYVLRSQGGYLWEVFRQDGNVIIPRSGPNTGLPYEPLRGIRQMFRQQTYLLFTVVPGLPVNVADQVLVDNAQRDRQILQSLLDASPEETAGGRLQKEIADLQSTILTQVTKRHLAEFAARRVMRDPGFRTSIDYVLFWTSALDDRSFPNDEIKQRNVDALNASIYDTLSNLIVNLPMMDSSDHNQIKKLKDLISDDFEPPKTGSYGLFRITQSGLGKLK